MTEPGRYRRLAKEGFWVVAGQLIAILGGLVSVRVLTEILTPSDYGELALGLTLGTLLNSTAYGPLVNGAARYFPIASENNDLGNYLHAVHKLLFSATGIVIIISCICAIALLIISGIHLTALFLIALLFAILSGYNSLLNAIQNAARQRIIVALHRAAESWLKFIFAAGILLWLGASSTVALAGYSLAIVFVLISQRLYFQKIYRHNHDVTNTSTDWQKKVWHYSWPFGIWGIFYWAQSASDRWALEFFASTQDVGLYAALFHLGYYPMSITVTMAMQFLSPIMFQRAGDANDHQRIANVNALSWRLTALALIGTFIIFLAALFFHTKIFQLFVAEEFAIVSHLLPWMLLSSGIFAASQTIALNLMSQMHTHIMMAANIVTAIFGVIFNLAGAYWYGVTGIVIANMMFSVLHFLSMTMVSSRISTKPTFQQSGL